MAFCVYSISCSTNRHTRMPMSIERLYTFQLPLCVSFFIFCFILPSLSSSIEFNFPLCIFPCVYVRLLAVFISDNGISMLRTLTCFSVRLSLSLLRFTVHTMSNEGLSFDKHSICTYICYNIMSSHFDLITSTELESLIILTVINAFFSLFFALFACFSSFLTTFFSLYLFFLLILPYSMPIFLLVQLNI